MNHRVFLNMASGTVEGDCLTVHCRNDFVRDSLNNRTVLAVLEEVTSAAVGSPVRVMRRWAAKRHLPPALPRSPPAPLRNPLRTGEGAPSPAGGAAPACGAIPPPGAESGGGRSPLPEEPSAQEENAPPWEGGSKDRLEELIGPGQQLEHFKIK